MVYKNNKKGAQGIGTLIIFIALILVAAVAAGVLISTAGKLQGKAENTGDEVQQRLATGFTVIQIGADNVNTTAGTIDTPTGTFEIRARLSPGSDSIKVDDIAMTLVTKSGSDSYTYDAAVSNTTHFTINGNTGSYINGDDVITIEFNASAQISESENFEIILFPGAGNAQRIKLLTPPAMVNTYTILK